ncbi:DNA primase large subunit Spp2 [Neodidymelliopsis sp. IMI 364377]|nr:DNA primase large subunit Spp2 [Neodidymelliopsis sp. IMI 364377]
MAAGGFKMSLGGLKAKPGLKAVAVRKDVKPKRALLGDDEPEDTNKQQEISGWDAAEGGAVDINGPKEKKGPLVIPSLPNRNWREEARKKQLEKAPHTQQQNVDVVMEEEEKEVVYGLTVPTKPAEAQENGSAEATEPMEVDADSSLTEAQRLEKAALESLLNGKSTDNSRIVPAITDEEALQNDLNDAPDEPSLDAYEATPIEGFGLAMLRGMGWKDSDGESARKNGAKTPKEVKRRPALLGIGAKEDAAKDVELGEFNSKARGKKGQGKGKDAPQGYNPVTLRNKKTGEVITEEELKKKLEGQEMLQDEKPSKESRRRDSEDEDKSERRRDRRDDRDRERKRDSSYDNERRRDRDRTSDRRRDKYDDYDSERRREKRDRRDRSRSPRDDSRREKRRDRYRSRSRDSKDRRERRDRSRSRSRERRKERGYDNEREERKRRYRDEKSSSSRR